MSSCLCSSRFCCDRAAPGACCTAPLTVVWDVASSGQSCLRFTWGAAGCTYARGYTLQLYNGVTLVFQTVNYYDREITFTGLLSDTAYDLVVTGVCSATKHSISIASAGVTFPAPMLGLEYTIVSCVPTEDEALCDLTIQYTDFICATGFSEPVWDNPPDGWAGTITRLSPATPRRWLITDVPYGSVMALHLTAEPLPSCNVRCGRSGSQRPPASQRTFRNLLGAPGAASTVTASDSLGVTLTIDVPPEPAPVCTDVTLSGLVFDPASSGSQCLTFSWTPQPLFTAGYEWEVLINDVRVAQGTLPNFTTSTVSVGGLQPSNDYTFALTGRCSATSLGNPVFVEGSTLPACYPALPPFQLSDVTYTLIPTTGRYTATIQYSGYTCVTGLRLSWHGAPVPGAQIDTPNPPVWTVSGLPPSTLVALDFSANASGPTSCASCCFLRGPSVLTTPVSFRTPAPPTVPCTLQPLVPVFDSAQSGSTCMQFSWTLPTYSHFAGGYTWSLVNTATGVTVTSGVSPPTASSQDFADLAPDTAYTFNLQGVCTPTASTSVKTVQGATTAVLPATLPTFTQTTDNTTYSYNSPATTANVTIVFPAGVCVSDYELTWDDTPPVGSVITSSAGYQWHISNVPVSPTSNALTMTATKVAATCVNGCAPIVGPSTLSTPVVLVIPDTPPTPPANAPFDLIITNYAGPPLPIANSGKDLEAGTIDSPVLYGAGDETQYGSYKNQLELNTTYAAQIVNNFVAYHLNRLIPNGDDLPYYLPLDTIYFGNATDPASQGTCVPYADGDVFKANLIYNYADSSSDIDPDPNLTFQFPPFLIYFKLLMTYNWEALNGKHSNGRMVKLALNNYGSKKTGEQWWFNCTINSDTGAIETIAPSDPKAVDSVIAKDSPLDGNIEPQYNFAGWNCMERWFMHAAYCNQQLRLWIDAEEIWGTADAPMTLDDITPSAGVDWSPYFQICAITTDSEGNGFTNTLYPATRKTLADPPVQTWYGDVNMAQCNVTMKALWDKWMNQSTTFPADDVPSWWSSTAEEYVKAPQPRILMPSTPFTLPCAMSMTSPGLLKSMTSTDLGSPDSNGVNAIFNEIYDTSNSMPFYYLGADTTAVLDCVPSPGTISGVPFSAEVQQIANPTTASAPYAKNPESYLSTYGTWDNLVLPSDGCAGGALTIDSDGALVPDPSLSGSFTAFNNATVAISGRMNTSQYDPWSSHEPWVLTRFTSTPEDYEALGWALESSRYDLYNGAWAAAAAAGGPIDYDLVKQGVAQTDGALIWSDLSTGLKPFLASRMTAVKTTACAAGQVWMLSCQSGPFVNCKGVRASARAANTSVTDPADFLTFMAPSTTWPGWPGMKNQWWGIGTSATAGVQQRWALDQMYLGPNAPAPDVVNPTNSSEDNFGVFADFNVQVAAWVAMAKDLQGLGLNPNGVSNAAGIKYSPATTGVPKCGCYELAFMPLSWFGGS